MGRLSFDLAEWRRVIERLLKLIFFSLPNYFLSCSCFVSLLPLVSINLDVFAHPPSSVCLACLACLELALLEPGWGDAAGRPIGLPPPRAETTTGDGDACNRCGREVDLEVKVSLWGQAWPPDTAR